MIDGHRGELRERLVDDQLCECVDVFNIDTGFGHGRHAQTVTECNIRVCSFPADLFGSLAAVKFSTEYHADALDFVGNGRSHMCKYCVEYGNGTKWYLNPANFDPELVKKPGHAVGYMNLTGASRNSFEWGGKDPQGPVDMGNEGYLNMAIDTMLQQAGQVIPLEDALQIIDVAPGDRFILQHCGCRRYFGFGDFYGCMFFDRDVDRTRAERPWETDSMVINKEEARKLCRERYAQGLVISIFDAGTDSDGKLPLCFCFCNAFDCQAYKARAYRGATVEYNKAEYVAVVDPKKCAAGCKNDTLIIVCDQSKLSFETAERITDMVDELNLPYSNKCMIGCRYDEKNKPIMEELAGRLGVDVLGFVGYDQEIASLNLAGKGLDAISDDNAALDAVKEMVKKILSEPA